MEPRERVLGPIARPTGQDDQGDPLIEIDFGNLVRKLILSEQIVVQSVGLKEIPLVIQKFGYDGVRTLLESGRVRMLTDGLGFANLGQYAARTNGPVLPLGSYSFSALRFSAPKEMASRDLHRIDDVPGLSAKRAQKLRRLVGERLTHMPDDAGRLSEEQLKSELESNAPILKKSVALAVRRSFGVGVDPAHFELQVERLTEWDWRTETNLSERTGLRPEQVHEAVGNGLSGAGSVSLQLELMKIFSSLTGFRANELPLLDEKFEYLMRQLDPDAHEGRFERVLDITGLPDVDPDPDVKDVDMARLIAITQGSEVTEFRRWLRSADAFTDEELSGVLHPVRDAIGGAVRSRGAKAVRLATTTGVGVLVPPVGIALSVLDTFLTEKLIPGPGPTAFLSRLYPSVFPDR
jgi:hypothetical protein